MVRSNAKAHRPPKCDRPFCRAKWLLSTLPSTFRTKARTDGCTSGSRSAPVGDMQTSSPKRAKPARPKAVKSSVAMPKAQKLTLPVLQ